MHLSASLTCKLLLLTHVWKKIPVEKVLIQEPVCADVGQRKEGVNGQKQSSVHGDRLQTLQTRLPAGQSQRFRLTQPINIRLEAKERTFIKVEWWDKGENSTVRRQGWTNGPSGQSKIRRRVENSVVQKKREVVLKRKKVWENKKSVILK